MPDVLAGAAARMRVGGARWASHTLVLAAVAILVLASAFTPPIGRAARGGAPQGASDLATPSRADDAATPGWLQPALRSLDFSGQVAGGQQIANLRVGDTRAGLTGQLPLWVRSVQECLAWSGPDDKAIAFTTLPANAYLQPLGPYAGGRLLTYFAGDGSRQPGNIWVDVGSVEPAEAPLARAAATPAAVARPSAAPTAVRPGAPRQVGTQAPPNVSASYVAVVDDASGQLMYGEKPHQRAPIASITKIATTIVALERGPSLDTKFTASISGSAMAARDGSQVIGMEPGERISFETLLYGMMLHSGNDAAEQVALSLGGTRERYLDWMNQKAASLGLQNTRFASPSGMDTPGHYSSAYDMAMLARDAMRNELFRKLASTRRYAAEDYVFGNLNRLMAYYPGVDGVKIGFTDDARKTIVASAVRDGRRVYVTLLRSEDLVSDSAAMFDWVWQNFAW